MTAVCFSYHLMAKNDVWISEEIAEEWKQTLDLWTRQRRNWEGLIELHWVDKIHLYLWNNNNNNMFLYSIPLQTSTATLWIEDWTKPNIFTLYHGNTPITITLLVDCWRSHFIFPITPGIPFFQKHNQMTWVRLQFYWNNVWKNARAILYLEVTGFRQHGQCQVRESDVFDAHAACNGFHVSSNCTDKTLPMSQRHFNKYI